MYPKLISIGSFYIPTYGVLVALGFLAGLSVAMRLARYAGLPAEKVTNLAVYCAMAGILGAKLFMILFDLPEYLHDPGQIFTFQTLQAAGVFHGGFIAAFVFAILYIRKQALPVLKTMDAFAPGIAIGQSIGRLGCFAAGCCWGKQCDLPWGVRFRSNFASSGVPLDKTLHPVQLYESLADLLIFGILYRQFGRSEKPGQIIALYLILYSTVRFIIEFFREHEQSLVGPFSLTQWIALGLLLVGCRHPCPRRTYVRGSKAKDTWLRFLNHSGALPRMFRSYGFSTGCVSRIAGSSGSKLGFGAGVFRRYPAGTSDAFKQALTWHR